MKEQKNNSHKKTKKKNGCYGIDKINLHYF